MSTFGLYIKTAAYIIFVVLWLKEKGKVEQKHSVFVALLFFAMHCHMTSGLSRVV